MAIGFDARGDWPWRAALVLPGGEGIENGFGGAIPAAPGEIVLSVPMEGVTRGTRVRVGIARGADVGEVEWRGRAP